jgi:site-specific DNA recombinase
MIAAVGYIRKSTESQSHFSLEYQEKGIRNYCIQNNLSLSKVFIDDGESSYTFNRPDFIALEKFIKQNKEVKYLVCFELDRFSRNLSEALLKIKELKDKYGVRVVAISDRIDTDYSTSSDFMIRAFKFMMAENELMKIRERVKQGKVQAAMGGYWPTTAPFGYKNKRLSNGRATLEIFEPKAEIIRKIYKLKLKGLSPTEIRKEVPEFTRKSRSAIQEVLSNPVYIGMVKVPPFKDRPEYFTKAVHPPIIDEITYNLAQGSTKKKSITKIEETPLRGLLKCWCGKLVTSDKSKGRKQHYWYYLCQEHRQYLSATKLHQQLDEILKLLDFTPEQIGYLKKQIEARVNELLKNKGDDILLITSEIKVLKTKIKATEEKYLSNQEISAATFNEFIQKLKTDKSRLEIKLRIITATNMAYMQQFEYMMPSFINILGAYNLLSVQGKQSFLKAIFGNNLNYTLEGYRTDFINPLFHTNLLIMKQKRLLEIEQPLIKISENSTSGADKTIIEHLHELYLILKAG